ncbi:50S ribosomal protein L33 [Nitzschia inconspicua]|uniref:Large ribosomal subunit protein bL33c n=1 Tax=Nitzschia inconspicua TaxID=303405 RepID=A0A9K3L8B4_9STRA|nr:50S ribosomal protein L33 [Nitzschia inconspicua]
MHSTLPTLARGKGKTIAIKLLSSAGTGFFYTTRKNVTNTQHKIALVKFDPIVRQRQKIQKKKFFNLRLEYTTIVACTQSPEQQLLEQRAATPSTTIRFVQAVIS